MDVKKILKTAAITTVAIPTIVAAGFLTYLGINRLNSPVEDQKENTPSSEVVKQKIDRYINNQNQDELIIQMGTNYFIASGLRKAEQGDNLSNIASIETVNKIGGYDSLREAFQPLYEKNAANIVKVGDPFYRSLRPVTNPAEALQIQEGIKSGMYKPLTNQAFRNNSELSDRL